MRFLVARHPAFNYHPSGASQLRTQNPVSAEKATKTSGEFDAVIDCLTAAERDAAGILDQAKAREFDDYWRLRLPADAAAFKRKLAAMLVGLTNVESCALEIGASAVAEAPARGGLMGDPVFVHIVDRVNRAAVDMVERLEARDGEGAIAFFREVEHALEEGLSRAALRWPTTADAAGRDRVCPA